MKQNYSFSFFKWITNTANKVCLFLILAGLPGMFYSQQSYTFTNASATGSAGPTQLQINNAYLSTNLNNSVVVTGGIQSWTVPVTGGYRVEARGAQGGGAQGGRGAIMIGDFTLTAGQVLKILVGQAGLSFASDVNISGGGGSYVVVGNNTIMVIAGGGGASRSIYANSNGTTALNGQDGQTGVSTTDGAGGIAGAGGAGASCRGGGGAGWLSAGGIGLCGSPAGNGGVPFTSGGFGGGITSTGIVGGFGGGGSSEGTNTAWTYAGGGGGYSGGGGGSTGDTTPRGGGGGSLNNGVNQTNTSGANAGNGLVIISELCSIKILAAGGTNSLTPAICSGNSLTLTTTAASNYTWSNGNTTTTSIVVSPTSSQTYSIIGTSTAACQAAASISVTVNSGLPVLTITNTPNSICLGKTATLTAGGAITYTWAGGPGGIINGQTFTPTATSNYTVTGQNGCGITTSVTTITIAPLVVNASATSTLICSGSPATLTAASAVTGYTWYPVAIPNVSVIVSPTANTVYTVVASDGTCAGVATVSLTTKPIPTLSIISSTTTVCEGALVTMTASGALTYTWTSPSSNAPNISDYPTAPTLYQVSGTNSVNCISLVSQIILTQPNPTVTVTTDKTIVCSGDPVNLTASGATTYNWIGGPATAGNQVNPTSNTTYTVIGTTAPCSGSLTININVLTASVAASVATPSICNGASASLHASGATSYVWVGLTSFNGNVTVSPSVTTVYVVNATTTASGLNCPSSNNITVTVFNNPTVTITATKTLVCKSDPNIVLTAGGATTYTWSTATVSTNISVHPQSTTTYSITGVDANGCMNTALQVIQVNACNGIAEFNDKKNNISIYPNPSNGEFVVSSDSDINLKLINELGQEVKTMSLTDQNDYKLSITNLANGVYFIIGQNNTDRISQKIIVAK